MKFPATNAMPLVIGATGPLGLELLAQAQSAGLRLRALARKPQVLAAFEDCHSIVAGDILNPSSLARALDGATAVVSLLGTPLTRQPVTLLSEGTKNLVASMQTAGVGRLLCVTGMGAGDSRGHGGWLYDHFLLPLLLGEIYKDKDRQEAVVRSSDLDWTLVRPARLTNGVKTMTYRVIQDLQGQRMRSISRADTASFLLGELMRPAYPRQVVNLSY